MDWTMSWRIALRGSMISRAVLTGVHTPESRVKPTLRISYLYLLRVLNVCVLCDWRVELPWFWLINVCFWETDQLPLLQPNINTYFSLWEKNVRLGEG